MAMAKVAQVGLHIVEHRAGDGAFAQVYVGQVNALQVMIGARSIDEARERRLLPSSLPELGCCEFRTVFAFAVETLVIVRIANREGPFRSAKATFVIGDGEEAVIVA